jgi:hypothetical protein
MGASGDVDRLRELFSRCTSEPVLVGPIHGDLHAANVRVRAADAIVIDFLGCKHAHPLVYDAACLEASLLVDGFEGDKRFARDKRGPQRKMEDARAWFNAIEILYEHVPLHSDHTPHNPKDPSAWFFACVRQVRLYARRMERGDGQYAGALAIALLKKASKDPDVSDGENFRRAAAFALAERVLVAAFSSESPEDSAAIETVEAS